MRRLSIKLHGLTCLFQLKKKERKTFVSSFGVYFGDPVFSFSDVTVAKQAGTRDGLTIILLM